MPQRNGEPTFSRDYFFSLMRPLLLLRDVGKKLSGKCMTPLTEDGMQVKRSFYPCSGRPVKRVMNFTLRHDPACR